MYCIVFIYLFVFLFIMSCFAHAFSANPERCYPLSIKLDITLTYVPIEMLSAPRVLQTVRAGLVRIKSGRSTVYHGSYGTGLNGSNSEKSNMSHCWPPEVRPPRVGTVRSDPFFFTNSKNYEI
jgi:hypothetical protein